MKHTQVHYISDVTVFADALGWAPHATGFMLATHVTDTMSLGTTCNGMQPLWAPHATKPPASVEDTSA